MQVVKELLSRGAKIDAATKKGNTALHIASLAGQVKIFTDERKGTYLRSLRNLCL